MAVSMFNCCRNYFSPMVRYPYISLTISFLSTMYLIRYQGSNVYVEASILKTFIHVNQSVIRKNLKTGSVDPVLTCKTYKSNNYSNEVVILDSLGVECAKVVYSKDKPLSCGARVWIETQNEVVIK